MECKINGHQRGGGGDVACIFISRGMEDSKIDLEEGVVVRKHTNKNTGPKILF